MSTHESLEILSPVTGDLVGWLPMATPGEAVDVLARAREAARDWARTPAAARAGQVRAAAADLRDRAHELAVVNEAETGRPCAEAQEGILAGAGTLEQYAELGPVHRGRSLLGDWTAADLMVPEPRGVVVALTPWNDPVAVACGLLGAALVTGNVVVHKPSERAPHTGLLLGEILGAHLPADILTTLVGDGQVGAALVGSEHVGVVAHVGSCATGRAIAGSVRPGVKVLLENGGNDPLLIDSDVDPEWAAAQAATGAFANSGQICTSVERIYVHQDIAFDFLDALTVQAEQTTLAPLVDRRHREHVHAHVEDALDRGATVATGGAIPSGPGAYYPATVLTGCSAEMKVMTEETFGPVAPVTVVSSFDEGLAMASTGDYGLAASVLTASMRHAQEAWRELPVGTVKINAVFGGAPGGAAQPRGASGTGFGYGPELLDEFTTTKVVHIGLPG
ncbi:aldehyde dehydrogenase family protein [Actinocrispum sp. NPDC049592]|uniref:aldehyde dehydrogenase family protein n=1 Tax=Actinocrispum sp. NPDC049592 TaxID=3154835 RepID=UPI00344301A7